MMGFEPLAIMLTNIEKKTLVEALRVAIGWHYDSIEGDPAEREAIRRLMEKIQNYFEGRYE